MTRPTPAAIRPLTPEMLADRWLCSAETVRQLVKRGDLHGFRVGRMIRIPMVAVEEYEACQNIASGGSTAASLLPGGKMERDAGIVLLHSREKTRKAKR